MKWLLKVFFRILLFVFILLNIITAFHAYKFTHFYDAGEIAAKTKADKSGLEVTKEILFGFNAIKRPNDPVSDSALQTMYFTTKDNIKIESWYIPAPGVVKGTVILFHGHGSTKSAVVNEAAAFRKMGYHSLLVDFRAHGGSGGNTCTIGYYEGEEVNLAYDYISKKGEKNILLWGISMGAAAITRAMDVYDLHPTKIILEMPFGSILDAAKGRIKIMGLPPQPLASMVTFWGGVEHGFWAFQMKPAEYAKKIKVPVLLQWGKNDPRVAQSETNLIYSNLAGEKKLVVYENSAHESLCRKENAKWLSEIQHFLFN